MKQNHRSEQLILEIIHYENLLVNCINSIVDRLYSQKAQINFTTLLSIILSFLAIGAGSIGNFIYDKMVGQKVQIDKFLFVYLPLLPSIFLLVYSFYSYFIKMKKNRKLINLRLLKTDSEFLLESFLYYKIQTLFEGKVFTLITGSSFFRKKPHIITFEEKEVTKFLEDILYENMTNLYENELPLYLSKINLLNMEHCNFINRFKNDKSGVVYTTNITEKSFFDIRSGASLLKHFYRIPKNYQVGELRKLSFEQIIKEEAEALSTYSSEYDINKVKSNDN